MALAWSERSKRTRFLSENVVKVGTPKKNCPQLAIAP